MCADPGIRSKTGQPSARVDTMTLTTGCSHGSCACSASIACPYTQPYLPGDIDG